MILDAKLYWWKLLNLFMRGVCRIFYVVKRLTEAIHSAVEKTFDLADSFLWDTDRILDKSRWYTVDRSRKRYRIIYRPDMAALVTHLDRRIVISFRGEKDFCAYDVCVCCAMGEQTASARIKTLEMVGLVRRVQ